MEIVIKADAKEIAELVLGLQGRLSNKGFVRLENFGINTRYPDCNREPGGYGGEL